jgi:hypothetical protein
MLTGIDVVRAEGVGSTSPDGCAPAFPILTLSNDSKCYQCPGERRPISRAVHLSRLAAFYPACRECEHRNEPGVLSRGRVQALEDLAQRRAPRDVFCRDGVRGVYLNDITRESATRLADAVASVLWDDRLRRGRSDDDHPTSSSSRPQGPVVVLGRDGRASSADVSTGAAIGLRRMGCHVVDAGVLSGPALDVAVDHLRADAGVRITGAGRPAAWSGLDVVGSPLAPWSLEGRLARVRERFPHPPGRPTRVGGRLSSCDVRELRRAQLVRFMHALPPQRVGLVLLDPVERLGIDDLLGELRRPIHLPDEAALPALADPTGKDAKREWRRWIREQDLSFGFLVSEDGRAATLIDPQGRIDPAEDWFVRLAEALLPQQTSRRIILSAEVSALARGRLKAHGADVIQSAAGHEMIVTQLLERDAGLATDGQGRVWLREHRPVCDGLVTLLLLIRAIGESGQSVAPWAA